ncbi:acyl-CoA thioesterase-1 [Desulfobaculum xiamenense]|uniref:Acyl-CoA thioesterase-1 n=1 Tax=Desulfobaculum xiamenense TaxID=995050 RepID=A0A846QI10_9BACT|nr:GDSL-type esterase/lipase family protein [Desulfobaculum xiamenense]NJB67888.1 acyl-CoA thioesterase-1 [Desulfobaculum xiamenense]
MKQDRQLTLLAFGDSITSGWGLPFGLSFPSLLEERLREADGIAILVRNAGVPGDTTAHGLSRLPGELVRGPDCAILALGINDFLAERPVERVEANLDAMLALFTRSEVPVLLAGVRGIGVFEPDYAENFAAIFPRLAARYDALLLPDLLDGVAGIPALNQPDGLHPNADGARRIADGVHPLALRLVERCFRV